MGIGRRGLLAALAIGAVGLGAALRRCGVTPFAGGPPLRVVEERDTAFGRLAVVDRGRLRFLAYGPGAEMVYQSLLDLDRPHELAAPYMRLMTLGLVHAERAQRVALIGAGAGNLASYLVRHVPAATVHAIDIDRHAVELGVRHFGLQPGPRLLLHVEDGRQWLQRTAERFDLILLDAYDDRSIPPALADAGFYALVAARLADGGVAMQNVYVPGVDLARLLAAMRGAFPSIHGYRIGDSVVLAAHAGVAPDAPALDRRAVERDAAWRPPHALAELLAQRTALP